MSRARTPFLAIGHTARDEFPGGRWRLGGSALYGAATAAKLGARVTLVTRVGPKERDALETLCDELGIALRALPGDVTTTFGFTYDAAGHRTLRLRAKAAPIDACRCRPGGRHSEGGAAGVDRRRARRLAVRAVVRREARARRAGAAAVVRGGRDGRRRAMA